MPMLHSKEQKLINLIIYLFVNKNKCESVLINKFVEQKYIFLLIYYKNGAKFEKNSDVTSIN